MVDWWRIKGPATSGMRFVSLAGMVIPLAAGLLLGGPVLAADFDQSVAPNEAARVSSAIMGYGEAGIGVTTLSNEYHISSNSFASYDAGAFVNIPFAARWNIEIEGRGNWVHSASYGTASDAGALIHAYWRDPDHFAVGAFGGYSGLNIYTGQHGSMWTGGAEAQAYFNNLTLYGQVAGFNSTASSGWLYFNGFFIRGTARFFPTPNLRLQLDAQFANLKNTDSIDVLTLIGTAEYRLPNSFLSGFASVRWDQVNPVLNLEYDDTRFMLGIRGYFGSGSQIDNDRHGAPMDVIPFPPLYALNFG